MDDSEFRWRREEAAMVQKLSVSNQTLIFQLRFIDIIRTRKYGAVEPSFAGFPASKIIRLSV
jgi:hypothetical protein